MLIRDDSYKTQGIANINETLQISNNGDDIPPEITIVSPSNGSVFALPHTFRINFSDDNFDYLWVTLNYSNIKYGYIASPGNNILINMPFSIWRLLPEGQFLVKIYVNDTAGNVNSAEINIIKELPQEPPPVIPGVNLFIIISCFIGILGILATKSKKKF